MSGCLKESRLIKLQFAQKPEKDKRDIHCYSAKFAQRFQRERNDTVFSEQPREVVQLSPSERFQIEQCFVLIAGPGIEGTLRSLSAPAL